MRLGDVIEIKHGYAFNGEHIIEEDNSVVLVTPGNFRIGGGFQEKKCKFFDGEIPQDYVLKAGDFIVTMTDLSKNIDTLGYSAWVPKSEKRIYLHNQRIGLVSLKNNKCDRGYIYWLMRTHAYQRTIANTSTGSTVHHTSPSKIYEYECDVPDISIQHRIATILSRYDSLIENYQKQIKLLEEAAQRLYKEWFVDLHFPGHENAKIVNGVPEGWEKKSVKTIVELQSGYAFKSSDFASDGIYKIVTIKNVKDGAFDGENVSKIASIPEKMPKHCILEDGDILLSLTGNVGRVCIVVGKNYLLNQRVAKLKSIFKAYTYCLFRSRDMFIDVNNLANGAAQQNVSPIKIGEMKILIPENKLLNEFEKESSNYISGVIAFQSQIRLLTEARDRLLPKMMSGEIEFNFK